MKRLSWMIVLVFLLLSINASAQDPGEPDTVFVQSDIYVDYNPGNWTMVYVDIDFALDNVIGFLNIPLTWTSSDGFIWPVDVIWRDWFIHWETYDTILFEEQLIRIVAWNDIGGGPIYYERVNVIDLRFIISPYAEEQYVLIDTTFDPRNGSLIFGDTLGVFEYTPIFHAGGFTYGEPTGIDESDLPIPKSYNLYQNYPNPFNANTNIKFALPEAGYVTIEVYNILGQKIKKIISEFKEAGYHTISWDGTTSDGVEAPSGVYFYRLKASDYVQTKKMVLMR